MATAAAAASVLRPGAGWARARPHAIADFFTARAARDAALSPNGDRVAVLVERGVGEARKALVQIFNASDPAVPVRQIEVGDASFDVETIEWANESRLLVRFSREFTESGRAVTGSNIAGRRSNYRLRRVISVGADGSAPVILFDNKSGLLRSNYDLSVVIDTLNADPTHVLMLAADPASGVVCVHRVSVITGDATLVERGGSSTYFFHTHRGVPVLREDAERRGAVTVIRARALGERDWKVVQRIRSDQRRDFFVVTGTDRPDVLLVGARLDGEDLVTVRELDLRTLRYGPPLFQRAGRDAEDGLVDEQGRLVAAKYLDDRVAWAPADKALAGHFRAMDDFFDKQANVHLFDVDATHTRFLALVRGPREPGSFYLYDKGAKRIESLGSSYPNLGPERLGAMETLRVKTRDGASIDAYLTAPVGRAPGPLVVLAHGGPEVRDSYEWDRQAQVLAAQGWWVLQPNFRGSGGYGRAFAEAGWKRWGDRMQEDVEDAVAHAVALRKLDAARVAIMGTSYGGYAALMGAARRPDLYKAAISICGVTDLPEMLAWERREDESADKWLYRHWVERIGDPRTDMARLEAASPRRVAAKLTMPVMLVHGEEDSVVPIDQSRMMHRALRGAGRTVEFREIERAGHADWEDAVEQDLLERYVRLIGGAFKA
jgi:dipeptidyl aminopeptidase/acylaminoacyl peptidase